MIYFTYKLVEGVQPFPLGESDETRVCFRYARYSTDGLFVGQCTEAGLTDVFNQDVITAHSITKIDPSQFNPPPELV